MSKLEFPNLNSYNYRETSSADSRYNCIAWAYGDNRMWFWPMKGRYWPANIIREATVEAFMALFASIGYQRCSHCLFEPGHEKVAIYALDGIPTHVARQLKNGKWTSKLGANIDIEHDTLECLNSPLYGEATIFMKREAGL